MLAIRSIQNEKSAQKSHAYPIGIWPTSGEATLEFGAFLKVEAEAARLLVQTSRPTQRRLGALLQRIERQAGHHVDDGEALRRHVEDR